jgi:hypothetical protein
MDTLQVSSITGQSDPDRGRGTDSDISEDALTDRVDDNLQSIIDLTERVDKLAAAIEAIAVSVGDPPPIDTGGDPQAKCGFNLRIEPAISVGCYEQYILHLPDNASSTFYEWIEPKIDPFVFGVTGTGDGILNSGPESFLNRRGFGTANQMPIQEMRDSINGKKDYTVTYTVKGQKYKLKYSFNKASNLLYESHDGDGSFTRSPNDLANGLPCRKKWQVQWQRHFRGNLGSFDTGGGAPSNPVALNPGDVIVLGAITSHNDRVNFNAGSQMNVDLSTYPNYRPYYYRFRLEDPKTKKSALTELLAVLNDMKLVAMSGIALAGLVSGGLTTLGATAVASAITVGANQLKNAIETATNVADRAKKMLDDWEKKTARLFDATPAIMSVTAPEEETDFIEKVQGFGLVTESGDADIYDLSNFTEVGTGITAIEWIHSPNEPDSVEATGAGWVIHFQRYLHNVEQLLPDSSTPVLELSGHLDCSAPYVSGNNVITVDGFPVLAFCEIAYDPATGVYGPGGTVIKNAWREVQRTGGQWVVKPLNPGS